MSHEKNIVLVTGAGRGIGEQAARLFLERGCRVLALDKDFSACKLPQAAQRIRFDLQDPAGIPALVAGLGDIDVLVNNAATLYCHPHDGFPEAHALEILAVNLRAPVALIEALAPQMRRRKAGRIINVASVAAFTGHPDLWYGASKAALLNITKSYASYLGPDGILVSAVAPGPTLTAMYDKLPQSRKDAVMRSVHSGRICSPEEVAQAIVWLGTESPPYMSGATLDVNNGAYPR
ncbi:MAG: short-chain dehydrogenase [Betaproteobacteria bacterium RIFCSPLOWO2_12_FULL_65_14]|nr:MAG: short-chain dehydrogenase [Betaproteobacteria bacterium RIFCSPLOWO2_12_FULL_65_14]